MRVAIVSKTFVADTAQRQLEWLARQPGIELTLITPPVWHSDDGRALPFTPRFVTGYDVCQVPIRFNGRYHLYVYRGLEPALRACAPEIVHIDEEPYNPAAAQAQAHASRLGARTVYVAWQDLVRRYPPPFSLIERYTYARAGHIIAGNAAAGEVLRQKGYRGPLSVFSVHGVDPTLYHPEPAQQTHDGFVIGYVGRLVLYKGVGLLIEALAGLPAHCRLELLGSGPDRAALEALAQDHGVADRVRFLPAVAATEVPRALAGMDVMTLPSLTRANWREQFGRTLIEAMACGVPVVGSDSGEIPRVIGDAGTVVPEGNVPALRAALLALAEQPDLRAAQAEAGRQRVVEHFTQEQVAKRIASVYASVVAGATDERQRGAARAGAQA